MKMYFSQKADTVQTVEEDLTPISLRECIEKTHKALDIAYAGFNNATDTDLIDSYIYEINALQKKYKHLTELAALESESERDASHIHSPIRALVSHVFN
ncbi:MAG: YaaL family protein [Firmicutes bacterium]|nr:YaaL family protein [Bacillota bacterium]